MYQTGPCSLNAVKQGQIYLLYDAPFVFAEVNADRIYWKCKKKLGDWDMKVIRVEKSAVGKFISTKAVGSSARHDITNEYKYPEGKSKTVITCKGGGVLCSLIPGFTDFTNGGRDCTASYDGMDDRGPQVIQKTCKEALHLMSVGFK